MNILPPKLRAPSREGSVLVLAVVVTAVIGFTLASYLTLIRSQNQSVTRSQAWNTAIPIVEAGIEDALAHLNMHGTNRLDVDGWAKSGDLYWVRRYFPDSFYFVTISNWTSPASTMPIIESRAFIKKPLQVAARTDALFAVAEVSSSTLSLGYLTRGVRVTTRRAALYSKGMVADSSIDLNGNDIDTDSFNSRDPNYSTDGLYDPKKTRDNGDIATNSSLTNSLNVGNAKIKGKVSTGPGGSVDIGPLGSVGDAAWVDTSKGIQNGHYDDDMNIDLVEVDPPFSGGGWTPGPGDVDSQPYTYVLEDGKYQMDALSLSSGESMYIKGDAVLYVTGDLGIAGSGYIEIDPEARLEIYVAGASAAIAGNGIVNRSGSALNFAYYGLPTNERLAIGGNGEFIGTIYAPDTHFDLNGSGKEGGIDFTGASITKTATLNGHFKFHYDEALREFGPSRAYVVTSWNELSPDEVKALDIARLVDSRYIYDQPTVYPDPVNPSL